jgi:hypothetical protein
MGKFALKLLFMKNALGLIFIGLLIGFTTIGQDKFTISGSVQDSATGESMIGVVIRPLELSGVGAVTNEYGFYSLTLPLGKYTFVTNYFGYQIQNFKLNLDVDIVKNISLSSTVQEIGEVVVTAEKKDANIRSAQMGVEKLDMNEINKIPVIFGEKDIIKSLQLLPGVKSAGEGNSGFYVRGGAADQNLILLDEAPVYNASHLLGFFSTFNSDVIKTATLYKGTQPAQYGGRVASVLDMKMNDGNNQRFGASGGIGLIASRLTVEGPIVKDKGSFLLAGRRTYADLFLKLSADTNLQKTKLFFYDLNTKLNYRIGEKDRIFVSGYFGRDVLGVPQFGINWGNATGTARWNHIISSRLFSNTSFIVSNYQYGIDIIGQDLTITIGSVLQDYNLKQEFQFYPNSRNKWTFGLNSIHHGVIPGQVETTGISGINPSRLDSRLGWENAVFVSNEWNATEKIEVLYGLRVSSFSVLGHGGNFYDFDENGDVSDTTVYAQNEFVNTYVNPEPRVFMSYLYSSLASVKTGYSRNVQNLHLISNTVSSSPTDLWLPTTHLVKPEVVDQVSLGWFKNVKSYKYEFSAETYYKWMQNQIDYRNGANTQANELIEGELLYGIGRSYGLELLMRKKTGKLTGWIGYTLSRTEKQIDQINNGDWYLARQDRLHDIAVVAIYDFSKKWSASATFIYSTGNAITFPTGKYEVDDEVIFVFTDRNGDRMPDYHRMDFALTYTNIKRKRFESSWNLSVYNVYARKNPYVIAFEEDVADPTKTVAVQTTLFRIVPTITYNFKF